ncbi:hypothetical protein WHZ78_04345 [Bradyrhizobium symbiodeficiens]|uniref:hypothetical protein n=1 Tax=Bradyrhizobium symbiodeficiens TaxID=1404367 RepID=UPI0030D304E5
MRGWVFVVVAACALAGCNTTGDVASTMYPEAVRAGSPVKGDTAIVLVGNGGSETINYLQFVHSGFPAINARGISLAPDGVVAIPIAVGTARLELQNYTTTGRPGSYLPNGVSMGFVPVHTPTIDIPSPGLYYVATVFPGQQRSFETRPTALQLAKLRKEHPELAAMKPVNFSWSN